MDIPEITDDERKLRDDEAEAARKHFSQQNEQDSGPDSDIRKLAATLDDIGIAYQINWELPCLWMDYSADSLIIGFNSAGKLDPRGV